MSSTVLDLRFAYRSLLRRPGFAVITVLTLALGIGASTTMFSVLNGVVLQPLPYPEPEQVVRLFSIVREGHRATWTGADFVDFAAEATAYDAIAGFQYVEYSMQEGPFPQRVVGASVTSGFFRVFRIRQSHGRLFSPAADPPGGARVVVLADAFWRSRFAADDDVVGTAIELNGESFTVAGIAPPSFNYPSGVQLWVASRFRAPEASGDQGDPSENRSDRYFNVIARLRDGVTLRDARHEGDAIFARLAKDYPETNRGLGLEITPLHEVLVASIRPMLVALFGSAGLLLLVACANVANIQLARATGRTQEMAVRSALGAERRHIARQLLGESLLLGLTGGGVGIVLALVGTRTLMTVISRELPRAGEVVMSLPVLVFALVVSLLSGVLFGLAPLLWLRKADPAGALRDGGGRSVAGAARARFRSALVAAEMAICLALLVGVSLLGRTLSMLTAVDPGFSDLGALTAQIWVPGSSAPSDDELRGFDDALLQKVRQLPGVVSAGAVVSLPIEQAIRVMGGFSVEGRVGERGSETVAGLQSASPGYFASLGIPLLRGRDFNASDRPGSPPVMIVSQAFADSFFPGEDPIGKRIGNGHPEDEGFTWSTIVGVVGSTRHTGLDGEPRIEAYEPLAQAPFPYITLVLRTGVPPASLVGPLRRAVAEVDPTQPVERIHTMAEIIHESLARQRIHALLLGLFAALALAMAAVGLYGVMAFSVAARTREIGIRVAVGAGRWDVVRLVLLQAGRLLLAGLAFGCAGGLLVGRLMRSFLYGVPPADPPSFVAGILTLSLAALLASVLPARRALRTDPIVALRSE